jgi:hypothetical protein
LNHTASRLGIPAESVQWATGISQGLRTIHRKRNCLALPRLNPVPHKAHRKPLISMTIFMSQTLTPTL